MIGHAPTLTPLLAAVLAAAAAAPEAEAPDAPPRDLAVWFDEAVVDTSGADEASPVASTVLDGASRDPTASGTSLADALLAAPGVVAQNRGNLAQDVRLGIRGFGDRAAFGVRGIRVVVDGLPLTLADGQTPLDLDPGVVTTLRVVRGPASALHGNSGGGALLVTTLAPGGPAVHGLHAEAGAFGASLARAWSAGEVGTTGYALSAYRVGLDGWREHARAERAGATARVARRLGARTDVAALASLTWTPEALDPGGLTAEQAGIAPRQASPTALEFDTRERVTGLRGGLVLRTRPAPDLLVEASAHAVTRAVENAIPRRTGELDRLAGGGAVRFRHLAPPVGLPGALSAGASVDLQRDLRVNAASTDGTAGGPVVLDQVEHVRAAGGFVDLVVEPAGWLAVEVAARLDRVAFGVDDRHLEDGDQTGRRVFAGRSGLAGATVSASPSLRLFANVGRSYESPTTTELVLRPGGGAGLDPDLAPQRATSAEAGARGHRGPVEWEVTGYRVWLRDELVRFEDDGGRTYYRNAGRSHRGGLEAGLAFAPRDGRLAGLRARAAYTLARATFDAYAPGDVDLAGNDVPGVPRHRAGLDVSWARARGPLASLELAWVEPAWADDANTIRSARQLAQEARVGWRAALGPADVTVYAGLRNPLGREYADNVRVNAFGGRFFEPAPPRTAFGGVRVTSRAR